MEKISLPKAQHAASLGFNTIFTRPENIDDRLSFELNKLGLKVNVVVNLFEGEEIWKNFPDARPVGVDGKKMEKKGWYAGVCPCHLAVLNRARLDANLMTDKVSISGMWLNFVRFPGYWESVRNAEMEEYCFCKNCDEKFAAAGGTKLVGRDWIMWKCAHIASVVKELSDVIRQSGRDLPLGLNLVPWRLTEFDGAIRRVLGQDPELLANLVDIISPMCHHALMERPVEWPGETTEYFSRLTGKGTLPIIQAFDAPGPLPVEEFRTVLNDAMQGRNMGVQVFYFEALNDERREVVRRAFA